MKYKYTEAGGTRVATLECSNELTKPEPTLAFVEEGTGGKMVTFVLEGGVYG